MAIRATIRLTTALARRSLLHPLEFQAQSETMQREETTRCTHQSATNNTGRASSSPRKTRHPGLRLLLLEKPSHRLFSYHSRTFPDHTRRLPASSSVLFRRILKNEHPRGRKFQGLTLRAFQLGVVICFPTSKPSLASFIKISRTIAFPTSFFLRFFTFFFYVCTRDGTVRVSK